MSVEDIRTLAQIANDKRLDEETREMAKDIFDKMYMIQHMGKERKE